MIKITLEFSEEQLNEMLNYANYSDNPPLKAGDMTKARLKELKKELQDTAGNFVDEIVEGSYEACANDWLSEFVSK